MSLALSKLTIVIVIAGIAVIAVIIGVTLGILLNPCRNVLHPSDLTITSDDSGLVQLKWLNSEENGDCSVSYRVRYTLNDEEVQVETSEPFYSFTPTDLCFVLFVEIWAVSRIGKQSEISTWSSYRSTAVNPESIPGLMNVVTSRSQEGIGLNWTRARELEFCNPQYNVRISSDIVTDYELTLNAESLWVGRRLYCFAVHIHIVTRVGENLSREFVDDLTVPVTTPQNMHININYISNVLSLSWDRDVLQDQCGLHYEVLYRLGGREDDVQITHAPVISFDVEYCNTAQFDVYTVGFGMQSVASSSTHEIVSSSSTVGPVQNIQIKISNNAAQVLWDSPRFVSSCTHLEYTVTATNEDEGVTRTCTGNSNCQIDLEDFCPFTNFTIQATSVRGEETWEVYECADEDENL